jgi:hypothetical protein
MRRLGWRADPGAQRRLVEVHGDRLLDRRGPDGRRRGFALTARAIKDGASDQARDYNTGDTYHVIADLKDWQQQHEASHDGRDCQPQAADRVLPLHGPLS